MSKIDKLIQELQHKKKKLDYINYIKELLAGDLNCLDYNDVKDEVLSKLIPQIDVLYKSIEDGAEQTSRKEKVELTPEQISLLAKLADNAKTVVNRSNLNQADPSDNKIEKIQELSPNEKMSFAMNNRHLANKHVTFLGDKNQELDGTVIGLDAPFVVVKTSLGPTVKVPLERISS